MPFHKSTKSLAKLLDPKGEFIPVCSIIDQDHYRPLCLLQKKIKHSWWKTHTFHKTEFRLTDVLLSGGHTTKLDVTDGSQLTIVDKVDGDMEGNFSGLHIASIEAKGTVSMSHVRSVKVKKTSVSPGAICRVIREAKFNMDHEFIQQLKECKSHHLYVVTEAVETVEETTFDESNKMEGSIFYDTYLKMRLKGSRDSKKAIIIPKSCILVFRATKLLLREEGSSGFLCFMECKRSFEFIKNEEDIQVEVKQECTQFSLLSANLRGTFLKGFVAVMSDKNLLQKLELQLEEALEGPGQCKLKADKPELQSLLENLQDPSGAIITKLAEAVLYYLGALDELGEEQLMLLEESLEKKIVSKQLALVKNILDNNQRNREVNFTVDVQLLTEEDLIITGAMIEMSGVTIKKTEVGLAGTGEPSTFLLLSALYVGLYVLHLLSE